MVQSLPVELDSYEPYPQCVGDLTAGAVERISKRYLHRLAGLGRGAARVVNKSLQNYRNLGLIQLICPGARVIHSGRDPLDTCVSC